MFAVSPRRTPEEGEEHQQTGKIRILCPDIGSSVSWLPCGPPLHHNFITRSPKSKIPLHHTKSHQSEKHMHPAIASAMRALSRYRRCWISRITRPMAGNFWESTPRALLEPYSKFDEVGTIQRRPQYTQGE